MSDFETKVTAKIEELRSALQADGGDMELVAFEGKKVQLRLHGACGGCPHAALTLKAGIERILKEEIDPEIEVERVL